MKAILLICLAFGLAAANLPTDSCTLCKVAVDTVLSRENVNMDKGEFLDLLTQYCNVLPEEPYKDIPSQQQCLDYFSVYGDYMADLALSVTSSATSVCESLKICATEFADFDILLPSIQSEKLVYTVSQPKVEDNAQSFKYRFFLGNSFDESILKVELANFYGGEFYYRFGVSKPNDGEYAACTTHAENGICPIAHEEAEQGQWYFVDIYLKKSHDAGFQLKAVQSPEPEYGYDSYDYSSSVYIYIPAIAVFLALALCAALCMTLVCCCCMCKKKCNSQCRQRYQTQSSFQTQPYAPVPNNNQYMPMMFYSPSQVPVQVPMQNFAPASHPVQAEDQVAADERLARELQDQLNNNVA